MDLLVKKNIIFTTCFFRLQDWNCKSPEQYLRLFIQLCQTKINLVVYTSNCYYDKVKQIALEYPNVLLIIKMELDDLNTAKQVKQRGTNIKLPTIRNIEKDTMSYFICMNSKLELIVKTLDMGNKRIIPLAKNYAWIDFGIFHIFKTPEITSKKLSRLSEYSFPENFISFPGCILSQPIFQRIMNEYIIWRFCGGFFIIAETQLQKYHHSIMQYLENNIASGHLTWEVNIWAGAEQIYNLDFGWYKADHNDTIIDIPCISLV